MNYGVKEKYAKESNPPVVGLRLFSKDGTFIKDISKMGFVWGISDDGFLFTAYDNNDALDSLTYLNAVDIIKGVSGTEIAPKQNTTREQTILISYRILKFIR